MRGKRSVFHRIWEYFTFISADCQRFTKTKYIIIYFLALKHKFDALHIVNHRANLRLCHCVAKRERVYWTKTICNEYIPVYEVKLFCTQYTCDTQERNGDTMKNVLIVAITAVIVSLDSFMAGFSLSLNKKINQTLPAAVTLITLLLCLATTFIGTVLERYVEQIANYFGAALLALLAILSLVRHDETNNRLSAVTLGESVTIGVAVGMDAAVANLTFVGSGVELIAPIVFAVTHYFTVLLGQLLAKKIRLEHTNVFSAAILLVLAITKII